MKTLIKLLSLFIIFTTVSANADNFPEKFFVNQRFFTWSTTFDLDSDFGRLGTVYRKAFTLLPEYHLVDCKEGVIAKATMKLWTFGATFDIYDANGTGLGFVEETFSWTPTFVLFNPYGYKLAVAQFNFWGTNYSLIDPYDNHLIAELNRSYFQIKNDWVVQIHDQDAFSETKIHPHMFLTLLAFQADMKFWAKMNALIAMNGQILNPYPKFEKDISDYPEEDVTLILSLTQFDGMEDNEIIEKLDQLFESDVLSFDQKVLLLQMLMERFVWQPEEVHFEVD